MASPTASLIRGPAHQSRPIRARPHAGAGLSRAQGSALPSEVRWGLGESRFLLSRPCRPPRVRYGVDPDDQADGDKHPPERKERPKGGRARREVATFTNRAPQHPA